MFKNLKVQVKLIISFGIMIFLFAIAIIASTIGLSNIKSEITQFYEGPYTVQIASINTKAQFESVQKYIFRSISTFDMNVTTESIEAAENAQQEIQSQLAVIRTQYLGDMQTVTNLENKINESTTELKQVTDLALKNSAKDNAKASIYMEKNIIPLLSQIDSDLNTVINTSSENSNKVLQKIGHSQFITSAILISMGLLCLAIGIILCLYITRCITQPLNEILSASNQMSEGNLKTQISYQSKDELGEVASSMRKTIKTLDSYITDISYGMHELEKGNFDIAPSADFKGDFVALKDSIVNVVTSYNDIFSQIQSSADQVANGSNQVASSAQALSQGATEQASSVEELAATINEISEQVQTSAVNSQESSQKASSVGKEMEESNQQMQEMIFAMKEISNSSMEIGKIIKTIEDIAFQTNILALNAAVEAARAGAAGKGFAVVADEVRNLASKSAEASKNTSSLIENSVKAVEKGTKIADNTAQSLLSAVEGANIVAATIDKVSVNSTEQANAISQVTAGIDQISSVVQTNSATAEESAAASQELSSQAQLLKDLVGRFQLKKQFENYQAESMPELTQFTSALVHDNNKY